MGTNLGVTAVQRNGQPVSCSGGYRQPTVPQGNRLIAIIDTMESKIARDVTTPSEFELYRHNFWQRSFLGCPTDFYLLDESKVAECPDEGFVPSDYLSFSRR